MHRATAKTGAMPKSNQGWIEMTNGIFLVGTAFVLPARGGSGGVDVGGGDRGPLP